MATTEARRRPAALGIYVHIPFCADGKCPYCDFYSLPFRSETADAYLAALDREISTYAPQAAGRSVDTVYFGGGTPSLLGEKLAGILTRLKAAFAVTPDAEITFEANPGPGFPTAALPALRRAGFNRISLGMQSAVPAELRALGRRHTVRDVETAVAAARAAGFCNLSLDLMLATPGQTLGSLRESVSRAAALRPEHISAYLLKVEPGTDFAARLDSLRLPDDDAQADFYFTACEALAEAGYPQYEISNFARPGFESRHNLRYWNCGEYLGFGPAAYSFFNGRRFHRPRSLSAYLADGAPVGDGSGGGFEETCMLRLRLTEGLTRQSLTAHFGARADEMFAALSTDAAARLAGAGYLVRTADALRLTRKGFAVSNAVISELLFFCKKP